MSWCEGCNAEKDSVEHVTAYIDYRYGPVMYALCEGCRDSEAAPGPTIHPMARIRELR